MQKKMALITGASRGIGAAIAEAFASRDYDLTMTCVKSEEAITELAAYLSIRYSISAQTFLGDLSSFEKANELFSGLDDLDILVNNAGISYSGLLQDMEPADWDRVIGTNLNAAFYCSKLAIPMMLQKKAGKIINISSVWGEKGASMEVAYSASKGGLNAFTKALAKELAPSNIQVNAIACGLIDTDMNRIYSREEISDIIEEIPQGRIGRPEEVAELVCSLCDGHEYLTGQIITLDGGWI
ncbi:MAG: SDR family NAD(P)-dependent oxidoreductase [Lachnospiraceae bacterium]|nr:SDR family NAD(P)-dependent oxidoreductase [Lachnospiraceae bacterium]